MQSLQTFPQKTAYLKNIRKKLLQIAKNNGTPLYVYDQTQAKQNLNLLTGAFKENGLDINPFYAVKSNPYLGILKTMVQSGVGLDVSSQRELKLGLKAGSRRIIYTGPAKTEADFALILKHANIITVNLESERELKLLSQMAKQSKKTVRCGLRVTTSSQKGWTKFGLPLSEFAAFLRKANKLPNIHFRGLHFHISMNFEADAYVKTFKKLGKYFKQNLTPSEHDQLEYIDMGGGFFPDAFEGIYTWNPRQNMSYLSGDEQIKKILIDSLRPRYIPLEYESIQEIAKKVSIVYKKEIKPLLPNLKLYCEPGRFICHSVMHMLMRVADTKSKQTAIVDGGNNMIGWERYQYINYVPLFNLSKWTTKKEIPFILYGPLCTPDDVWGYYLYTNAPPKEGDIITLPFQGAYTYTLAQNFIKDIPKVVHL